MSTAAHRGTPIDGNDARAWRPALGRVAVAVGGAVVVAVVMTFLMLPIVALFTYQPLHELVDGFGAKVADRRDHRVGQDEPDRVRADDRVRHSVCLHPRPIGAFAGEAS